MLKNYLLLIPQNSTEILGRHEVSGRLSVSEVLESRLRL